LKTARESSLDTHEQAHAFGEALYLVEGLSGLQYCDSSFEFGCYHSFFGVAVLEKGIGVLSEFSDACRAKFGDYNLPCEHGIGHGVLVYTDYENLEQALLLCKTISDLPTGGCSSGVFMENNFHTMDETREGMFVRPDEGDLFAPCNSLKEEFQASCYLEQVQWWQSLFNSDFEHIGGLCNTLTQGTENYEACFHGIGNYLAAEAKLQVAEIVTGCARMPDASSQALCHEGASWLVRGDGTGIEDAKKVCTALMGEPEEKCLNKLR
jgi:hypothetical protein